MVTDAIIVGQGIAGTCLAHAFYRKGKSFVVIDDHHIRSSSLIAAGLFNPMVFRRLTCSWKSPELIPAMEMFYGELERLLNKQLIFTRDLIKLFAAETDREKWQEKSREYPEFLSPRLVEPETYPQVNMPHGGGVVMHAGYLDLSVLLSEYRQWLCHHRLLREEPFDYTGLELMGNHVAYGDIEARRVIFCEGYRARKNPWFDWLPFRLAKGEVLTIRCKGLKSTHIINKNMFILPLSNDLYRVGATYEWKDLSDEPTPEGREELLEKLNNILKTPYEVIDHQAGIRPTTTDRRPLIGVHPECPGAAIFNGLGTKGVMQAPFFAMQLTDFLEGKGTIDPEANVRRAWKKN